jgi:hypothetical protein
MPLQIVDCRLRLASVVEPDKAVGEFISAVFDMEDTTM